MASSQKAWMLLEVTAGATGIDASAKVRAFQILKQQFRTRRS